MVVPRLVAPLLEGAERPLPSAAAWQDTRVVLPEDLRDGSMLNVLTRREYVPRGDRIEPAELLRDVPVALLLKGPE